jgi:Transposase DDE domain group 1
MDSSESPTYGAQEGGAYNGHFGCTCHHPLFVFNQFGDIERCALRPGNVHSAAEWRAVLEPVIARYRDIAKRLYFRGDAAFANPEMYEFLDAEGMGYTIRLPATMSCSAGSAICSSARAGDRRTRCAATMPAFATKPAHGQSPDEWWPRSSGIRVSFIRASALSSPTWRGRWSVSSPSIPGSFRPMMAPALGPANGRTRGRVRRALRGASPDPRFFTDDGFSLSSGFARLRVGSGAVLAGAGGALSASRIMGIGA